MKNHKIIILSLLATLLFTINLNSAQAAPESITIKRTEVLSDLVTNKDHGFTMFKTTDEKTLYCLDNLKKAMYTGQIGYDNGKADDGILYILQNGYPNKNITSNTEIDKYITQAAIWWYMDETKQGSNQLSDEFKNSKADINNILPLIKTLVANAKQAKSTQTNPTITLAASSGTLSLTSDNNNYESQAITVKTTNANNYNVIFEGGTKNTKITDMNGNPKTEFKPSEKFKVIIPANELKENTEIKIKITATNTNQIAKIYKPTNSEYQRVVGLYEEKSEANQVLKLTASPNTTSIEVEVPNTNANILLISIFTGIIVILIGIGIIYNRSQKIKIK